MNTKQANVLKSIEWVEAPSPRQAPTGQPVREQKTAGERELLANLFDLTGNTAIEIKTGRIYGRVYEVSYIPMPEPRRAAVDPILPLVVGVELTDADAKLYGRYFSRLSALIVDGAATGFYTSELKTMKRYSELLYGIIYKRLTAGERRLYARVLQDAYLYPSRHAAGL